jgi:hypothetical protein
MARFEHIREGSVSKSRDAAGNTSMVGATTEIGRGELEALNHNQRGNQLRKQKFGDAGSSELDAELSP